MKLSKHLELAEVIRSDTAKRLGINNYPTPEHLEKLKILAVNLFEPIREHFGVPIFISSGYRSKELNAATPGSRKTSQHPKAEALDIDMDGSSSGVTNLDIFNYIKDHLLFDQLIAEFPVNGNPSWVHVSYAIPARKQILISTRQDNKVIYLKYNGTL